MIPWEVGSDKNLTHGDVRVYFALAGSRRGKSTAIGMRLIGSVCGMGHRKIGRHIRNLATYGHVKILAGERGQRTRYELLSGLFAEVEASTTAAAAPVKPTGATLVPCGKCGRGCKRLPRTGICRACANREKLERQIDQRSERVARLVYEEKEAAAR
jgi:hypothetical protein